MILVYLDKPMVDFDFDYLQEVYWDQSWTKKSKLGVLLKFSLKVRAFQNPLNGSCTTMRTICGQTFSTMLCCLLELC